MAAPPQLWEIKVVKVGHVEIERLLDEGWEPFSAAATSGPDGNLFVLLRRVRQR